MSEITDQHRMYCVFARESLDKMNGIRGKMASMAGHGYLHSFWDAQKRFPEEALHYLNSGMAFKITLVVDMVEDLHKLYAAYKDVCGVSLVVDAGRTVFKNADGTPNPTTTCLGLGPLHNDLKGEDLGSLRPLT